MRIVIVGAGAVGSYLAERLSTEGQDVVVIEADERRAAELQDRLDALVVVGNGASPSVLAEAQVDRSDLLIAVSNTDGANVLACHNARDLGVRRTVARVEDPTLREGLSSLGVDVVIDPGEAAAQELARLVGISGISELIDFARGELILVGGIVQQGAPLTSATLAELRRRYTTFDWVVVAVIRDGTTEVARGTTQVRPNDHVLLMVAKDHVDDAIPLLGVDARRVRRAIILGSTRLAEITADLLAAERFDVVMVDGDADRCRALAESHGHTLVVCGDPTDPEVLADLKISDEDAVLGLSGWDEVNIVGCLLGKSMGASTTAARFHRIEYVSMLSGIGIDAAVSARLAAANAILRFVRRGRIHSAVTFKDSDAEALEIEVPASNPLIGKRLAEIDLPGGAIVGGILRHGAAIVPTGETILEPNDRLIVFALPEAIHDVERLFAE